MLKTIKQGDTGTEVRIARLMLGMTDSEIFDTSVVARTLTFQREKKLVQNGIIDSNTWTELAKTAKTIRSGDKNIYVKIYQYLNGKLDPDGIFGSKTKASVVTFQKIVGLTPDGIIGQNTWKALIIGTNISVVQPEKQGSSASKPFGKPKDYKQGGSPWGKKMYSSTGNKTQTYANSGCGPTSAADIVASMKDKNVTPETLGILAVANGYRTKNSGTAWAFFRFIANRFGFSKFAQTLNRTTLKAALDTGALAIASMAPGYWTKNGHFICVWQDDGIDIHANDPASTTRKKQDGAQFMKECKQLFLFWP